MAASGLERLVELNDVRTIGPASTPLRRLRSEGVRSWLRDPPILCLAAAVVCSGAVLIALAGDVIFLRDEWAVVLYRRGFGASVFLDPHAGHLAAAVIAFYKLGLATFGMTSPLPFHIGSTLIYLLAAVLLFVYTRRRVGGWLALLATLLILFLGASYVDLLSPFQIVFSGAIAAGLGALLALDREDRGGDIAACVLLVGSMAFSELGIAFTVGALVRITQSEQPLRGRLFVALVPLSLYALWWLGWGHTAHSYVSFRNAALTPLYVVNAGSAAIASLLGLASASDALPGPVGQQWGPPLLIVALVLAAWRIRYLRRVPSGVWAVLAIGLTFWVLAGLDYVPNFREPGNGRYLYPSAVFVLLIAVELLRGVRPSTRVSVIAIAVTAIAIGGNLAFLKDGYDFNFKPSNEQERGAVSALGIDGPMNQSFVLNASVSPVTFYDIGTHSYLSAVDSWGSPGYSEPKLAAAPDASRSEADKVFAAILGIRLGPPGRAARPCRTVHTAPDGWSEIQVGPGTVTLAASGRMRTKVALGRFSDELPVDLGTLNPGSRVSLEIPADRSARPWRLGLQGAGSATVCGERSSGTGAG